jgi:hypothetical protein
VEATATRPTASGRIPVVIVSLIYLLVRRLIELLVLRARSDASKDVEILVLLRRFFKGVRPVYRSWYAHSFDNFLIRR